MLLNSIASTSIFRVGEQLVEFYFYVRLLSKHFDGLS